MKLYNLYVHGVGKLRGQLIRLTRHPMTHDECRVMKSKFNLGTQSRILFVEVSP